MKVAFWSNHPESGVTSNMIMMGTAISLLYRAKLILTSNHYGSRDLGHCLTGNGYPDLVREARDHYNRSDYADLTAGSNRFFYKRLDEIKYFGSVGETRLQKKDGGVYYFFRERYFSDYMHEINSFNFFGSMVDQLEKQCDYVFMDLQSQGSFCSLEELEKADLVVVNLKQDPTVVRDFFRQYGSIAWKSIFLMSSYVDNGPYLKRSFVKDFRIHPERIALIPFNRELASGYADGRIVPYLCNYFNCGKKHPQYRNIWYIRYAAALLMRTLCDGPSIDDQSGAS